MRTTFDLAKVTSCHKVTSVNAKFTLIMIRFTATFALWIGIPAARAALEAGEQLNLTIRGVDAVEQQKISGVYRIGESGKVRLPMLDSLVTARGPDG